MSNPVKLFIVEGEDRDYRFVNSMTSCFFGKGRFEAIVINLPVSQNIYMLFKSLMDDGFNLDIVEILRDTVDVAKEKLSGVERQDIDEVFLFFDYDTQQDNLPNGIMDEPDKVLRSMLEVFNNETENGKLYINYPMVEALYDYKVDMCESFSGCFADINELDNYKEKSGENNPQASKHFHYTEWRDVLNVFLLRITCLWELEDISFEFYRTNVSPYTIFGKEKDIKRTRNQVFVLSSFPEFLFDYFKVDFWNKHSKVKHFKYIKCPKLVKE